MRVIAIDPGYGRVGIAVIEKLPRHAETLVHSECLETDSALPFAKRLHEIGEHVGALIAEHRPAVCALEKIYFEKNQKTAMQVAEARGVLEYVAAQGDLPVYEYTPLEIKAAVAGDGRASKEQVMRMLPKLIGIPKEIRRDDEYDAIAVGLTCLAHLPVAERHV